MTLPRQLLQIDYDQFHRYAAVTVLLKPLLLQWQAKRKPLRILEVGSHALNLLPAFLSPLHVEIVRADLEPQYAGEVGPYVTIQPNQPLPFADGSFDVTVAMEVLEHIPSDQRQFAVNEWARVASRGIFFTCPNGEAVADQENRANADFQARHGRVHPWLMEHDCYGRPTQEQVQELCRRSGLHCHRFYNSPLSEWLPLLLATEHIFEHGDRDLLARFNEMLNTRAFQPFTKEPGYRCIYAAFKSHDVERQAQDCWQAHGRSDANDSSIDPVRMLARRLSQFVIKHRQREVDGARLIAADADNKVLRERLQETQQELICERWRSLHKRSWWRPTASEKHRIKLTGAILHGLNRLHDGCWQATSVQPRFEWACNYQRGWNRIDIAGIGANGETVILYPDYGNGFCEDQPVRMGTWKPGITRFSVNTYFHHPVKRMRMVPCQSMQPVMIDSLRIRAISAMHVALQGTGRLLTEFVKHPRWTWLAMKQSRSLLRLGMQMTMMPGGLPIGAETEYHHRLMNSRPATRQRAQLIKSHTASREKLAVFLRLRTSDTAESIASTLQSLTQQDACSWELWCAIEDTKTIEAVDFDKLPVQWLRDRPDRGLAGLLNECAERSQATWLMMMQAGDMLEPDACIQLLQSARDCPQAALIYADEDELLPVDGPSNPTTKSSLTPQTLREEPARLGHAVAFHVPTLLRLGGFHPAYEGALITEYLYRLLEQKEKLLHLNRVLLHQLPRPLPGLQAQKVLERLREEYSVDDYNVRFVRLSVPVALNEPSYSTEVRRQSVIKEEASC